MARRKSVRKSKRVQRLMSNKRNKRDKRSRINKRSKRNKRSRINKRSTRNKKRHDKSKRNKRSKRNKSKRNKSKREIQRGGKGHNDLFPETMQPGGNTYGMLKLVDNKSNPLGDGEGGTVYEVESGGVQFAAKISLLEINDEMSNAIKEINILTNFDCIYLPNAFYASFYINTSRKYRDFYSSIIIMEKMDHTLLEYITNDNLAKKSMDKRYDFLFIGQMVSAVKFLHENSIIHLDLKPSNIGIKFLNGMPIIKIFDFGISDYNLGREYKGCPTKDADMKNEDEEKVTEQWRSPDIYSGDYNCKSDMWSVGIIILQIMAREKNKSKDKRMKKFLKYGPFMYGGLDCFPGIVCDGGRYGFGINNYIDDFISFCTKTGKENKDDIINYVKTKTFGTRFTEEPYSKDEPDLGIDSTIGRRRPPEAGWHEYKRENKVYFPSNNEPDIQEFFETFEIKPDEELFTLALECLKFIPDQRISAEVFLDDFTKYLSEIKKSEVLVKLLEEYNQHPVHIHSVDALGIDDLSPSGEKKIWYISEPLSERYNGLKKSIEDRIEGLNLTLNKPDSKINVYIREEKEKDVLFYQKHSSEGKKGELWKKEIDTYRKKRWDKIKQTIQDDDTTFYQKHSNDGTSGKLWVEESDTWRKERWVEIRNYELAIPVRKKKLITEKITRLYELNNMTTFGMPGTDSRSKLSTEFEEIIEFLKQFCKNKKSEDYKFFCEFMIDACIQEEFIKMGIKWEMAGADTGVVRQWIVTPEQSSEAKKSVKEMLIKYGIIS